MEGKKAQGLGYLKKKAPMSTYHADEELENDTDGEEEVEREEEKRKGVMDRFKGSSSNRVSSRLCQVDRCTTDLKEAKQYHRRHKVCEVHAKASSVYLAGRRRKSSGESFGEGAGGRRGVTSHVMQNQERSRVEMTLPMSNSSFKRPQIR
ncbi:hypothetical protein IGI04_018926 [Brassica rapa subsp. trilocularis]|uniref:SBP-type domain-containing protein n=1 Tax=Brassica rapa subsp. trilocularis TaxID=1813537 RepID=A0ABQ7MEC4_BRACM|nr:hypothetical protein IGI04_018926 [Brassica rapa subsp. trilocularis]